LIDNVLHAALVAAFGALAYIGAKALILSMVLIMVMAGATFSLIPFVDKDHLLG
jgi:hypothetical protein